MKYFVSMVLIITLFGCKNEPNNKNQEAENKPAKVTISKTNEKFELLVNNEPFYINGAGLEFGNIDALAQHNANSFRTWRTQNGKQTPQEILDKAQELGLMVTMGIDVGKERHGFDYNDSIAVQKQLEKIRAEVMELKDHPALLIWGIGNELNLRYTNPKVWDAVNDISKMIHEVDPNHLTTTMLAGISEREINLIKEKSPDLDLLSFQMYGSIIQLPQLVKKYGWEGPYMVTEWGATGHWEVPKTEWDAPIEENSTVKAANYLNRFKKGIQIDSLQCVGSYVFLWGQKQERTPTWYGVFLENGNETEAVDVMHFIWNNKWPENRTPQIESFKLNNKTAYENVYLEAFKDYEAKAVIKDFEKDSINFRWEILKEGTKLSDGGDFEPRPESVQINPIIDANGVLKFKAPALGKYRLFVYADDGKNQSATANIPFMVR
jgi:hypothetical protein